MLRADWSIMRLQKELSLKVRGGRESERGGGREERGGRESEREGGREEWDR
jgi:hypothetical protein